MAGHYATTEADVTITHHLPPPEDDSTQDISMSFAIPPQADASNLLDQNYDDFFSGPGFVTLNTPIPPRHLANSAQSVRKVKGTIQPPAVLSGPHLGQILTKNSKAERDSPNYRTELHETHISPNSLPSLSPSTKPATSTADPGPPRPSHTTSESDPDSKVWDGPTSNATRSVSPIITTAASGAQPGIQLMSTSEPSPHSTNPHNAQISRQFPTSATQMKNKARGNISIKPSQIPSKTRSGGGGTGCETSTRTQTRTRGGAVKRPDSTLSNHSFAGAKGRIESNPVCSKPRSNVISYAHPTGNEHPDPGSLDVPAEGDGAVTQILVKTVLPPPSATARSRFNLEPGGADMGDCSSSLDPPRTTQDHVQVKISSEEEDGEDDQLTVSQLSPSKTVRGGRDHAERSGWNEESAGPTAGTPLAVSPMRPSKKRASSAGQESDNEPDSARPDEWEKQRLVVQSNREGEVRGGGEGKQDEGTRREADGEKALLASRKKSREGSSSLTLTRRLKAKAVRESPRVRKLRDKLAGRVGAGRRRPVMGDATHVSRGGHACGFPGNAGASTTPSVATVQGKGSDRISFDETTGPSMPYSGDNKKEEEEDGAVSRFKGSGVGGPSFRSTLKRSTVPVEFRFELAGRLGTSRGSAAKEKLGPRGSGNSKERGGDHSRKRPKLGELRGGKNGEVGFVKPTSSSRLSEGKDGHPDQIGSHTGAWKGKTRLRSNISSGSRTGGRKRKALIIPEEFKFSTEKRAKDREEFDKGVRVKQEEKDRRLEEERAAKAVEEEREIKEMRKRAVPKASTVPEWYAAMPKRKPA